MLTTIIARIVDCSRRLAWLITVLGFIWGALMGWYSATHFKINTDINQLMASDLSWRKQEKILEKAFPQKIDTLLIVVDGSSADKTENAAAQLALKLKSMPEIFTSVTRPDSIPFFRKNGLLFLSKEETGSVLDQLVQSQPMLGTLTSDPSLRGFFSTFDLMAQGVQGGMIDKSQLQRPLSSVLETVNGALAGKDVPMAWQDLMSNKAPKPRDLRKFILTKPVLNYSALEPGEAASAAIRQAVKDLALTADNGVRVRLTGPIPLNDEEFASVANGTSFATALSGILVLVILLLALRSLRIIIPIVITLVIGLATTTAFALFTVGSLNLISVAFAVMFIGIAVDFGIQFGVRYRDQHYIEPDHAKALMRTINIIAVPLAMAAGSTSLGFIAFIPTAYRGVSELGLIAGGGMLIAFSLNIILLPALLTLFKPPAEPEAVGFKWAAPLDNFILVYRRKILVTTGLVTVVGIFLAMQIRFDFDPLNLKDPKTESVSTLFDLMRDPDFNSYTVELLRPSLPEAQNLAAQLEKLPEVDHVMTLASFIPEDQDAKLALIEDANSILGPTLNLAPVSPPTNDEVIAQLKKTASAMRSVENLPEASQLADALEKVANLNSNEILQRLQHNLVETPNARIAMLRDALSAKHLSINDITDDLRRDWVTKDGNYLLQVYPKGNPRDHRVLTEFTKAVLAVAPDASGSPISIQESGNTVTSSFVDAGCYAVVAIGLLAWLILRRISDVLRLLAPLLLAGILTLATMVIIGLPLNFANIIALPLLLSLGVSYAIYFVSYWRTGMISPLQSSMARAVLFSAATTLVAFGTLSLSSHPGTAGMGELLTVALLYSLTCTFFILPALLGAPKDDKR